MEKGKPDTRERILQAAKEEFLEKGYPDAWLRDIAAQAGVTTGALYGYFASKEELFGVLVSQAYQEIQDMYRNILNRFQTFAPKDQLDHMMEYTMKGARELIDYMYANHDAFKLILCCSQDTEYADLADRMAVMNEQATHSFEADTHALGVSLTPVHPKLEHILTTGMFTMFFELIAHDIPREEADRYTDCLILFFSAGYANIMGF